MLVSLAKHNLDEKGRIVVPAVFRGSLEGELVVAAGDHGELELWPKDAFLEQADRKQAAEHDGAEGHRQFTRFMANSAEAKLDGQFRIALPENLRTKAGIDRARPLYLIGLRTRIAIWDNDRYEAYVGD